LFHGVIDWFGRRIHEDHHKEPYYHISIDGVELVMPVIALACVVFFAAFGITLGASCAISYVAMGLLYEFTHYIVHTRWDACFVELLCTW
jgi:hypothetical protein